MAPKVSKVVSLQTTPSHDYAEFRNAFSKAVNIVVVAGAGLSAASGIPTFRGAGGLWLNHDATALATPEAFKENPALVWQFYQYRREIVRGASHNKAHRILARLSKPSTLRELAPKAESFHFITQNIDGLSPRAVADEIGDPTSFASSTETEDAMNSDTDITTSVIEMHGRLFEVQCTSPSCGFAELNYNSSLCPALDGSDNPITEVSDLPACPKCGSLARPGVVWFGEKPRELQKVEQLIKGADICIIVGTSGTVYPAAGYPYKVKRNGGTTAIFNMEATSGDRYGDYIFRGMCEQTLAEAFPSLSD